MESYNGPEENLSQEEIEALIKNYLIPIKHRLDMLEARIQKLEGK